MVRSSQLAHDGSTVLSAMSGSGFSRAPGYVSGWCSDRSAPGWGALPSFPGAVPPCSRARTSPASRGPGTRSARVNAWRRSARSRHPVRGCSQAPRPGRRRRGSGTRRPLTATTRSRSVACSRVRHPTHVRIGVDPRRTGSGRRRRATSECSAARFSRASPSHPGGRRRRSRPWAPHRSRRRRSPGRRRRRRTGWRTRPGR